MRVVNGSLQYLSGGTFFVYRKFLQSSFMNPRITMSFNFSGGHFDESMTTSDLQRTHALPAWMVFEELIGDS